MTHYEMPDGSRVDSMTTMLRQVERESAQAWARVGVEWAITEAVHGRPETLDAIRALIRAHDDEGNNETEGEE